MGQYDYTGHIIIPSQDLLVFILLVQHLLDQCMALWVFGGLEATYSILYAAIISATLDLPTSNTTTLRFLWSPSTHTALFFTSKNVHFCSSKYSYNHEIIVDTTLCRSFHSTMYVCVNCTRSGLPHNACINSQAII